MKRAPFLLLLSLVALAAPRAAHAHWQGPLAGALVLSKQGRHVESAAVYRLVADWPEVSPSTPRAQALHTCGQELELAGRLEDALASYREVMARFADHAFAGIARRSADRLEPPGVTGGLEFRRRHDAALEVLLKAMPLAERRELEAARPGLVRSLELLAALYRDFPEHPQAVDVAIAISDVLVRLERLDDAHDAAEEALALARKRAAKPDAAPTAPADVVSALRQLDEARRAIRLLRVGRGAKGLLALLTVAWCALRPWRRFDRRIAKLAVVLLVLDVVASIGGAIGADYVKRVHAPGSPVEPLMGALLVFVPGLVGMTFATGFAITLRGRLNAALIAGLLGFLAALATTTCIAQHYGFFDFLPDL